MTLQDEVRLNAAALLRDAVREGRDSRRALLVATDEIAQVGLAAVESVEALADVLLAVLPQIDAPERNALELTVQAAWDRLAAAGLVTDGAFGEEIDLARHRVLKPTRAGQGPERVGEVVACGVLFKGRRLREATVTATRAEGTDGTDRN